MMISAIAESQTVQKNIAIVIEEVRFVEASVIARIATIARASQICKKTQTQNLKRKQK